MVRDGIEGVVASVFGVVCVCCCWRCTVMGVECCHEGPEAGNCSCYYGVGDLGLSYSLDEDTSKGHI